MFTDLLINGQHGQKLYFWTEHVSCVILQDGVGMMESTDFRFPGI